MSDHGPLKDARDALAGHLISSGAGLALVIDEAGRILVAAGDPGDIDPTSFASVCAAHFEANLQLASLVGEPEFRTLLHQGERASIYLAKLDEAVLAVVYDGTRLLGEVGPGARALVERVDNPIRELIAESGGDSRVHHLSPDWVDAVESEIERVFKEGV